MILDTETRVLYTQVMGLYLEEVKEHYKSFLINNLSPQNVDLKHLSGRQMARSCRLCLYKLFAQRQQWCDTRLPYTESTFAGDLPAVL